MVACGVTDFGCQLGVLIYPIIIPIILFIVGVALIMRGGKKGLVAGLVIIAALIVYYFGIPPLGVPPASGWVWLVR